MIAGYVVYIFCDVHVDQRSFMLIQCDHRQNLELAKFFLTFSSSKNGSNKIGSSATRPLAGLG